MQDRAKSIVAETEARQGRRAGAAVYILLGVVLVILLGLGTWQVERLQWKEGLIASIEARRTAPPITIEEAIARLGRGEPIDYTAIRVTGRFDHSKERHFLATRAGKPGYHVYTPLILADGGTVFVNRGFVPDNLKEPDTRLAGQVEGEVGIVGLARDRLAEKPSMMVPENEPQKNLFFWKDLDAMASSTGIAADVLLPFFIDADAAPNPGGYPEGGVTQIDLPNNHLSYAATWYGLAAVLVVVSFLALRRRGK